MSSADDEHIARLVAVAESRLRDHGAPLVLALDGRSGTGKSTMAAAVAACLSSCTVIEGDQFYAGGSNEYWESLPAADMADRVIDWSRQRPVLEALRDGRDAVWHPFDWTTSEPGLAAEPWVSPAAAVIILDGAYSARPELADLVDVRVLVEAPDDVRRARLVEREGEAYTTDWQARWTAAEDHYFKTVLTPDTVDLRLQ